VGSFATQFVEGVLKAVRFFAILIGWGQVIAIENDVYLHPILRKKSQGEGYLSF
jgi:hypothetical protein